MKRVFVDTSFWIAIVRPGDPYERPALEALMAVEGAGLVTTEEVLGELCTALSRADRALRQMTVEMIRALLASEEVEVLPQSHQSFLAGLELYEGRLDQASSLTDCVSMSAMYRLGIGEVLTPDHHFEQEGFGVLVGNG